MLERVKNRPIGDETIRSYLESWGLLHENVRRDTDVFLVGPTEANDKEDETNELGFFNNSFHVAQRLNWRNKVITTNKYRTGPKRADYVIRFLEDWKFKFGIVNNIAKEDVSVFLQIEELFVEDYFLKRPAGRPREADRLVDPLFKDMFYKVYASNQMRYINSDNILAKCMIYELDDDTFCVFDYHNENEHD